MITRFISDVRKYEDQHIKVENLQIITMKKQTMGI